MASAAVPALDGTVAGLPKPVAIAYCALFATAAIVYGTAFAAMPVLVPDSPTFMSLARDLLDGSIDGSRIRGPGYALLLIATGATSAPTPLLFFASMAMQFAAIWLVAVVLHEAGVGRMGLLLLGTWFVLPHAMQHVALVTSETTAQLALVAGVAGTCLWLSRRRAGWLVAASLAIAYAGLVRPSHQLVAFAVAPALLSAPLMGAGAPAFRRLLGAAAVLLLGTGLLVGGYAWINARTTGSFSVTTFAGFTLSTRTARMLERVPDDDAALRDLLIAARDTKLTRPNGDHLPYDYLFAEGLVNGLGPETGLSEVALSNRLHAMFTRLIVHEPINYLYDVFSAAGVYWMPDLGPATDLGSGVIFVLSAAAQLVFVAAFWMQLAVVGGAALVEGARMLRRRALPAVRAPVAEERTIAGTAYALAFAVVAYTFAISCLFSYGTPRLRAPTELSMGAMIVLGWAMWSRWSADSRPRA